ncbi:MULTISPECIES: hypothetical protein [unclassified Roseofilum]|uniref:hypothetical protein n=1 Tax=unclassified Roseofilum TaxID=2620099 RepID=UPI001B175A15|nr:MULTISPECIES: hypothetical protein [unclassified Roseofilum]MBP0009036.1 hypothetical protein [Roseofilum sp. Belize Diploria]MBP0033903.1 hypothetical protein [Roseofilum sp. Belize BBD 4]
MDRLKLLFRIVLYILIVPLAIGLVVLSKLLFIFLADQHIYSLPIIGDIFRMLDLSELSNLISFAILGLGFGLSTIFLPPRIRKQVSLVLLVPTIPFILSIPTVVRYNNWLNDIAENTQLSSGEIVQKTDGFLEEKTGKTGMLGFYLYTAKFPILPTQIDRLNQLEAEDSRLKSILAGFLGDRAQWLDWVFAVQGWLLRAVYGAIAIVTTLIHFQEGSQQLQRFSRRNKPKKGSRE